VKRAVFHPEASREYLEAIQYHGRISADLAVRFDLEIQHLVKDICRDPERRSFPPAGSTCVIA
jgi:hypothetical protein